MHGFEYGALEVKNHLERLMFSNIVSTVTIMLASIRFSFSALHFSSSHAHLLCYTLLIVFTILVLATPHRLVPRNISVLGFAIFI